ncbi:hypothetical protein PF011_g1492 [Phytophthora fragariae]|uniref:Uncharacterized protein n=2 Tax=Phytophthora fragariae TaxID=53985 RepID=A0A6A3M920_9STRA|nr:hypothetical protein PF011_g1492 [Phytophthora fragariae]
MAASRSARGKAKRRLATDDEEGESHQASQDGATPTTISVTAPEMEQTSFDSCAEFQTFIVVRLGARNTRILERACLQVDGYDWRVRATLHSWVHNHRFSEDVFNQYSRLRVNLPDDVADQVNQMLSLTESTESTIKSAQSNAESAESTIESAESVESAPESTESLVHAPVVEPHPATTVVLSR